MRLRYDRAARDALVERCVAGNCVCRNKDNC